jgi:hypothetical protein
VGRWLRCSVALACLAGCGRFRFHEHDDAAPRDTIAKDAAADAPDAHLGLTTGCADGQREGLLDEPLVAACGADWLDSVDLRAAKTGAMCGDDAQLCQVAADACASGWHVCASDGTVDELITLGSAACHDAGPGAWVAASSHCGTQIEPECAYADAGVLPCYATDWCAEPLCCGSACFVGETCQNALFPASTPVAGDLNHGCGAAQKITGHPIDGVLCCAD